LRRELAEELGIVAEVGRLLATTRYHYAGRGWVELTFFEVCSFKGVPTNLVFADIRWEPIENLRNLDFLEADREIIRRLSDRDVELPHC